MKNKSGHVRWLCDCSCGNSKVISLSEMKRKRGGTKSCGCLNKELTAQRNFKHGFAKRGEKSSEYNAFVMMKHRCTNPNAEFYYCYGGRGILFKFKSFIQFYKEVGPKPSPAYSIDRIRNNGHYEPGNVKWSTASEQALNRRAKGAAACTKLK
jgi:hypothetical protein